MDVKVTLNNAELAALEVKLAMMSDIQLEGIHLKQLTEMKNRAVRPGGTPVDTGALRTSVVASRDTVGYTKEYAPHVEYGHRMVKVVQVGKRKVKIEYGWMPGQRFLKANVDAQRFIYYMDLLKAIRGE